MPPHFLSHHSVCVSEYASVCVYNLIQTQGAFSVCLLQSCSECSEPRLAQSLCTFCNKWLCYQCTDMHQHQRAPTTSQYTDLHQQPRPTTTTASAQCPDLHQRGPSSLPATGQGKQPIQLLVSLLFFLRFLGRRAHLGGAAWVCFSQLHLQAYLVSLFSSSCSVC